MGLALINPTPIQNPEYICLPPRKEHKITMCEYGDYTT